MLLADVLLSRAGSDRDFSPGGDVCHPLRHAARRTKQKNLQPVAGAWFSALLVPIQPVVQSSQLTFGKTPKVNRCFCDHSAAVQAACQNTYTAFQSFLGFTISMTVAFCLWSSPTPASRSRSCRSKSKEGPRRTFSTCFSHLVAVITYYFSIALAFLAYRIKMLNEIHILSDMNLCHFNSCGQPSH